MAVSRLPLLSPAKYGQSGGGASGREVVYGKDIVTNQNSGIGTLKTPQYYPEGAPPEMGSLMSGFQSMTGGRRRGGRRRGGRRSTRGGRRSTRGGRRSTRGGRRSTRGGRR